MFVTTKGPNNTHILLGATSQLGHFKQKWILQNLAFKVYWPPYIWDSLLQHRNTLKSFNCWEEWRCYLSLVTYSDTWEPPSQLPTNSSIFETIQHWKKAVNISGSGLSREELTSYLHQLYTCLAWLGSTAGCGLQAPLWNFVCLEFFTAVQHIWLVLFF